MGKLVSLLLAGTGATATAVGGSYLIRSSGTSGSGQSSDTTTPKPADIKVSNDLPAKTWEEFKAGDKVGDCVTKYFGNVSFSSSVAAISESNKVETNYFSSSSESSRSCLVLN